MTAMAPAIDLDALLRRLHLPTVRRLYPELGQRAEPEGLSYRDFLAVLMAEEVAHRAQTRIQRCVRRAHFPFLKTIEEFDFTFQSSVRLALLGSVLGPELVTHGHCLIASGPSGTGKTHLAVAIAYRAIQNGFDARFTTATALIDDLSVATRKGTLRHVLPAYTHPHVLVIDEVGYLSYGPDAANVLLEAIKKADSTDPAKYLPALAGITYQGVTGSVTFDENGDVKGGSISLYQVKDGKWQYLETIGG
jgi:DNA replication protein DnaC